MLTLIRSVLKAAFLDIPYLIDRTWRYLDFWLNGEFRYQPADGGRTARIEPRACWRMPIFWLFSLTVVFVAYGPVWDGLCTVFAPPTSAWALAVAAGAVALAALYLAYITPPWIRNGIASRFGANAQAVDAGDAAEIDLRRFLAGVALWVIASIPALLLILAALWLADAARSPAGPCAGAEFSYLSLIRLIVCAAAIVAFGMACSRVKSTNRLLWIQAGLVAGVALIHWVLLAPPEATEASGQPYRHIFSLLAPSFFLAICLAPLVAKAKFRPWPLLQRWFPFAGLPEETRRRFSEPIRRREIFVPRGTDPELTMGRVIHAVVHGTLYRPMQLLLPPSLLAFVAPPNWLTLLVVAGFIFSLFMLTWGSIASRWQQMVLHVERWFMSGTSLPVSIFVMVIAALRVLEVDYVSTILDAAPLGMLFGAVVMSYVLSWLIEYWINRVVAMELLRVLGSEGDDPALALPRGEAADPAVRVEPEGRFLMSHGIGQFLVVGTVSVPGAQAPEAGQAPRTAFHSYSLGGLFRALAGREDRHVAEIGRHAGLYFYVVNALLVAVVAGFVAWHAAASWGHSVSAVAEVRSGAPIEGLNDLAARLAAPPGGATRPAIVVVASGGGTRAALYTAHVLEGLHRLGEAEDIVLMSGVSGGGVALAYFAANYARLAPPGAAVKDWAEFKRSIAGPFIQDVLEGATEWRVFGASPLTTLLVESFERRLPGAAKRLGQLEGAPSIILNTTIVGHPAEESDVLSKTLDRPDMRTPADCVEKERPFALVSGGRLIFTNIRSTSAFPSRAARLPDVRLPYWIVQDPGVALASAAALNANFPPVFPNARVIVKDYDKDAPCPRRSFFVTDGGAEENLGLVSALYAVRSALEEIRRRCAAAPPRRGRRAPGCPAALRPVHFVIAEASGASFDYRQDRGVSTALSGAKERLTGGLTGAQMDITNNLYRRLAGRDASARDLRYHYLALPLVFRARGGFGTHWMHAETIKVSDPRRRAAPLPFRGVGSDLVSGTVTLSREDIAALWSELHSPGLPFCDARAPEGAHARAAVRRWICEGTPAAPGPRDGHMEAWQSLVAALK
jgi:hypothetical protein